MTTTYQPYLQFQVRETKKAKIQAFFEENLGQKFNSQWLHGEFGSSFRTRVSDINADEFCRIVIRNEYVYDPKLKAEISKYWAELK